MTLSAVNQLLQHREILLAWTSRTIRSRYQQSALGVVWAILQPAASVIIFAIVFTRFIPIDTQGVPYIVFAYTAMVPWTFFAASLNDMVDSLVNNMGLVAKIYFPREILPVAALLARLLDFGIASAVLAVLILLYQMPVNVLSLAWIPVILATQIGLSLGLGFATSALNVFYRDIRHLIGLGLQLWLYATPIIYPASLVPEALRTLYFLNPMAGIIESYRAVILRGETPPPYLLLSIVVSAALLAAGYWFFKRVEFQFADVV
jgi:lipopolysaccharide transport system permease protein